MLHRICLWAVATCALAAYAQPQELQKVLQNQETKCYGIEMFTPEWFLGNMNDRCGNDFIANAMFYSAGMSKAAVDMAKQMQKITIWEVWPPQYYIPSQQLWNPMRCIHRDPAQRQTFFENMSRAYAQKAREGAVVLHSTLNYDQPPTDGIWATIELPILRNDTGPVNWILRVKEDMTKTGTFWERTKGDFQRWRAKLSLTKRTTEADLCSFVSRSSRYSIASENLEFFDQNVAW